jgi:hypothetical protein
MPQSLLKSLDTSCLYLCYTPYYWRLLPPLNNTDHGPHFPKIIFLRKIIYPLFVSDLWAFLCYLRSTGRWPSWLQIHICPSVVYASVRWNWASARCKGQVQELENAPMTKTCRETLESHREIPLNGNNKRIEEVRTRSWSVGRSDHQSVKKEREFTYYQFTLDLGLNFDTPLLKVNACILNHFIKDSLIIVK